MSKFRHIRMSVVAVAIAATAGCATVTDRLAPDMDKGAPTGDGTFLQAPSTDAGTKPPAVPDRWWEAYDDPALNGLMTRLNQANPDVAAALARVDQSFAILGITRASKQPTIRGEANVSRRRDSLNNLLFPIAMPEYWQHRVGLSASWEVDLWGRVRGMARRDAFRAEAQSATYAHLLLSLQGSLAQQYFAYRSAVKGIEILETARHHAEEHVKLETARIKLGAGVASDVSRARIQAQAAIAAVESARRNTGKLLHAIAVLTGTLPSELTAMTASNAGQSSQPPAVPAGLPSDLLIRRADLLAADRLLRAAATQIGIRRADFLPKVTLVGNGGFASLNANNLFETDGVFFGAGPQVDIPIFGGGVRKAAVAQARAQWREAAANYQSVFLTAVREVDDALLEVRSYADELRIEAEAVQAANEVSSAAKARYEAGLTGYAEFLRSDQSRLNAELRANAIRNEQLGASVRLIQALGGSW